MPGVEGIGVSRLVLRTAVRLMHELRTGEGILISAGKEYPPDFP